MRYFIAKTTPTNTMLNGFNGISRNLFDNAFLDNFFEAPAANDAWTKFHIKQNDKNVTVTAELAGVKKEDLNIEVIGDTLKISGHRGNKETKNSLDGFFDYAEFSKTFTLSDEVDTDKIEAAFENGFLKLTLSKSVKTPTTKKIEIK